MGGEGLAESAVDDEPGSLLECVGFTMRAVMVDADFVERRNELIDREGMEVLRDLFTLALEVTLSKVVQCAHVVKRQAGWEAN